MADTPFATSSTANTPHMVTTRRSLHRLASNDRDTSSPLPGGNDGALDGSDADAHEKRVKSALRKLEIHGTPALIGNRVSRQKTTGTYHYRGAVYDITDDTPQAWIDQQPMRYKRPETTPTQAVSSDQGGSKRKLASTRNSTDASDDDIKNRPNKRLRHSMPPPRVTRGRTQPSPSKSSPYPTRSAKATQRPTNETRSQSSPRGGRASAQSTLRHDDMTAHIAAARAAARKKGYQIEPLPDPDLDASSALVPKDEKRLEWGRWIMELSKVNTRIDRLSRQYREYKARGDFDVPVKSDMPPPTDPSRLVGQSRENGIGRITSAARLDPITTTTPKPGLSDLSASLAYASPVSANQPIDNADQQVPFSGSVSHSTTPSYSPSAPVLSPTTAPTSQTGKAHLIPHNPTGSTLLDPTLAATPLITPTNSFVSSQRKCKSRLHGPTPTVISISDEHTSLSSSPRSESAKEERDIESSIEHDDDDENDEHQDGEEEIAGKLTAKGTAAQVSAGNPNRTPKLSSKLNEQGRAESAIYEGRRQGETDTQWRRRVMHELNMMRAWPTVVVVPKKHGR